MLQIIVFSVEGGLVESSNHINHVLHIDVGACYTWLHENYFLSIFPIIIVDLLLCITFMASTAGHVVEFDRFIGHKQN